MCLTDSAANNCVCFYKTVIMEYVYKNTSDYSRGTHNIT
jgi:hypothetical protein